MLFYCVHKYRILKRKQKKNEKKMYFSLKHKFQVSKNIVCECILISLYLLDLMENILSRSSITVMANSDSNMVGIILKNEWTRGNDWEPGEFLFNIILLLWLDFFVFILIFYNFLANKTKKPFVLQTFFFL